MAKKILVFDRDPALSSLIREALEYFGYEAEETRDFHSTVEAFGDGNHSLAVLGVEGIGVHIGKGIRERDPSFPLIMIKSPFWEEPEIKGGRVMFLTKPFSLEDLKRLVKSSLPENLE